MQYCQLYIQKTPSQPKITGNSIIIERQLAMISNQLSIFVRCQVILTER